MKDAESIHIRLLEEDDPPSIAAAFQNMGWNKPEGQYRRYLQEQAAGTRTCFVATVDGHDFGLGKFNIVILTDDPPTVFGKAHSIVINQHVPNVLRSAYREMDDEDYVILWPSALTEFTVL